MEDSVPSISGLPELLAHLQELANDASAVPNAKLLDDVELQLTGKSPFTDIFLYMRHIMSSQSLRDLCQP
jgi:hypothetical protein